MNPSETSIRHSRAAIAILTVIISGSLYAASLDIGPIGVAVLIAPVPVLLYALSGARTWQVFCVAALARLIGSSGFVYAYASALPWQVLVFVPLLLSFAFAIEVLLARAVVRRLPVWAATLSLAVFTTALEFVLQSGSPHGTFGALGYSLIDATVLTQVASLGGIAAVTFIAALVPMIIALLVAGANKREVISAGLVPLVVTLGYGIWRLSQPYDGEVKVALASIDSLVMSAVRDEANAAAVAQAYADVGRAFPSAGLEAVVFPERMFVDSTGAIGAGSRALQELATSLNTRVIAGLDEASADGDHHNTARVFEPAGPFQSYAKRRLIPGLESGLVPGKQSLVLGDRGVAVCKDLDFAPMIREYGQKNVRLMFVPAWDFVTDGRLHSRMAVMRGVENGFAVARAASMGRLTVSDAFGRVIAETVTSDKTPATLVASVGLTNASTLYARVGDVFAWSAVVMALVLMIWMLLRWRAPISRERGDVSAGRVVDL